MVRRPYIMGVACLLKKVHRLVKKEVVMFVFVRTIASSRGQRYKR